VVGRGLRDYTAFHLPWPLEHTARPLYCGWLRGHRASSPRCLAPAALRHCRHGTLPRCHAALYLLPRCQDQHAVCVRTAVPATAGHDISPRFPPACYGERCRAAPPPRHRLPAATRYLRAPAAPAYCPKPTSGISNHSNWRQVHCHMARTAHSTRRFSSLGISA